MKARSFFRTDFLDDQSLSRTRQEISDYADTVGKTRSMTADVKHAQRGAPSKLASAMMKLSDAKTPPTRLPLGSDTVAHRGKHAHVEKELAAWRDVAASTDWVEEKAA
ncbi:hypothetical protein V1291_002268 [Nitrobacteraceae bacterium AZCC 1564]